MDQYIVNGQAYNVKPEDVYFFMQKYPNAQKVEITETKQPSNEVRGYQNFKNNLYNAFETVKDIGEFWGVGTGGKTVEEVADEGNLGAYSGLNIASTIIWESVFGKEKMKEWKQEYPKFMSTFNSSDSETFKKVIENFAKEKEDIKETMSFSDANTFGEYLNVAANAVVNAGGSVAYNLGTLGTGFFMDYAADNFIEANKIKAESKGLTLDELIKSGDADVAAPVKIAAFQTALENIGLGAILKPFNKGASKILGKNLVNKYPFSKNTRIGLDILSVGATESVTEMGQTGLEIYNSELAKAKTKEKELSLGWHAKAIADGVFSDEAIEAGLQGFFGGKGLRAGSYSAKALTKIRKNVSDIDVEKDLSNLVNLRKKFNDTKDEDIKAGIEAKITSLETSINDKIKKGNDIYNSLSQGEISQIESLGDLADVTAFRATKLNKKLANGEISAKDHALALEGLTSRFKSLRNQIQAITNKKTIETFIKEGDLQGKVTEMTSEEISNIKEEGFDSKEASTQFGFIRQSADGSFEIVLNKDKPMAGTAAHEFMHAVLFKTLGNNQKLQDNLGNALIEHTAKLGGETSILGRRLAAYGKYNKEGVFERDANFGEETITIMSEEIINGNLKFNENFFTKIGDIVRRFSQEYLGKEITFNTGRDVYNFVKDYSKSIKEGKINKAILKVAKEGAKGKLITKKSDPKAATQMSKEASDNVQRIYDNQGEAGAMDIIDQFKPIVNKIVDKRKDAPNFDRQLLTDEIETGKRGIFDLIREYDPKSGVPLAAYINKFLPARAIEASKRVLGEEFTQDVTEKVDIAAEEVTTEVKAKPKPKKIVLADRLNVKNEVDKTIKNKISKINTKELTFKKIKNLVPDVVGKMFGISPKKLISLANITKSELQAAQMFISKNADLLISMLPEGSTQSGTATGVPNSLLKAFYTKTDRAKMAKTGSASGLPIQVKNKINRKDFLEVFGIIDGKPDRTDRNTSARVLALANLTGKMMTNQAIRQNLELLGDSKQTIQNIREGASSVMFSKSVSDLGLIDFRKLINDPKDGINNFDLFTDKMVLLATYMPPGLIRVVDLRNFGITNPAVKDYARSTTLYEDLGVFTIGKSKDRDYLRPDAALGKNVKEITKAKVKKYNESGKANFDAMVEGIRKAIKDNPNDKQLHGAIYAYLSSAVNDTTHPLRTGAEYIGGDITATGEIIYEHALQNASVRDLLMDTLLNRPKDFNKTLKAIKKNYKLIALSKEDANAVDTSTYIDENGNEIKYKNGMGVGWDIFVDNWFDRYFNPDVNAVDPNNIRLIENNKSFADEYNVTKSGRVAFSKDSVKNNKLSNAAFKARTTSYSKQSKGITVLDFDDTLATTESLVKYTAPDGETGTLNAEQFASTYQDLQDQGYTFDFSDFNRVVKGKLAPLFNKALKLQKKFGPENMFVLTARPPAAQQAIFDFLKANGLNIPLKNITGLGNSTSEAKALWMADKVAEGYNDFYFADDALQNVQAVKNMLDQFDVKSKVQQAKVKFSKDMDGEFNNILEDVTGIESKKRYSQAKARKRGEGKGRFRFFVPPSHEDFAGLLYNFMGKGEKGNKHREFFEQALLKPLNRAYQELTAAKQAIATDYKNLIKQFPVLRKKLTKKTPDGDYYYSDAVRVYLWDKAGFEIPGMSKTDVKELSNLVKSDPELQAFADNIGKISRMDEGYIEPGENWEAGDIRTDLADATGRVGRAKFFNEFQENADIIFSKENLNKIEAAYGRDFREALEDVLYRTKTGTNRTVGQNKIVNGFLDYLNGSIGATMFFNARSAVLQTLSTVNFINFGDNNVFKAAAAFANQKQFWKDFVMIFNSDVLKQRRAGVAFDINANEIASAVGKSKTAAGKVRAAVKYLLQIGFLPTQIADSFAISLGGASMYRNRVNTYKSQGLSQKEAEAKAFTDFQEVSEATQQSARPDMISQQQASVLGRLILAFQNTPSQYVRLIKKAGLDLINRRKTKPYTSQAKSDMSNISRIIYYGTVQNIIFGALQTGLFAMLFSEDDEEDEKTKKFFKTKKDRVINGTIDTILRGSGVAGAIVSTIKNGLIKYHENQGKKWNKQLDTISEELIQLSPPIGIKKRKLDSFEKTLEFNKKVIPEMDTFDLDNPIWYAYAQLIEGATNIPVARLHRKVENVRAALNSENEWWQRLAVGLGWSKWDVGIENKEVEAIKEKIKKQKKENKKSKFKNKFKPLYK